MDVSIIPHPSNFNGFLDYYSLRAKGVRRAKHLDSVRSSELFISVQGRVCTLRRAVELESLQLAQAFREFLLPSYLKRNGNNADIVIVPVTTMSPDQNDFRRINVHSMLVRSILGVKES